MLADATLLPTHGKWLGLERSEWLLPSTFQSLWGDKYPAGSVGSSVYIVIISSKHGAPCLYWGREPAISPQCDTNWQLTLSQYHLQLHHSDLQYPPGDREREGGVTGVSVDCEGNEWDPPDVWWQNPGLLTCAFNSLQWSTDPPSIQSDGLAWHSVSKKLVLWLFNRLAMMTIWQQDWGI